MVLVLSFMIAFVTPAQVNELPPVPDLVPLKDEFDATQWEEIETALNRVRAEPESAEANGKLGMILHARERYKLAEPLYHRSHQLLPATFSLGVLPGSCPGSSGKAGGRSGRV